MAMNDEEDLERSWPLPHGGVVQLRPRPVRLTREGLRRLEEELRELREVRLPEVAERIRAVRQMAADLSESDECFQALEEMNQVQARIAELELAIGSGEVAEEPRAVEDPVHLGSVVTVSFDGERETYEIVGSVEADPLHGKLSMESPLGQALIGRRVGEEIEWRSPDGVAHGRVEKLARDAVACMFRPQCG